MLILASLASDSGLDSILPPGEQLQTVAEGYQFLEGPAWRTTTKSLLFSDIPASKIFEYKGGKVTTYREQSHNANGNTFHKGWLYTAEHGSRTVTRTSPDGKVETIADRYEGKLLNSPNDVIVSKDGDIYFTDPTFGLGNKKSEIGFQGVYRLRKGKLTNLTEEFVQPNGLALSPDEKLLYVDDSLRKAIYVFDLTSTTPKPNLFAKIEMPAPNYPDGMRVDRKGNIYCTAGGGVHIFDPKGKALGMIRTPDSPTNCAWAEDGKSLFITAGTRLHKIRTLIGGTL
jgi:gluconolactonase